jgi:hypothetical protein
MAYRYRGVEGVVIKSTGASRASRSVGPAPARGRDASSFRAGEEDPFRSRSRSPRFDAMEAIRESMVPVAPPKVVDVVTVQSPRATNPRHRGRK